MNHERPTGTTPQIENPGHLSLPDQAEAILTHMFATQRRVVIKAELGSGFSGGQVFLVHPTSDLPELPTVVKMGPAASIEKEYRAYREFIHDKLSGVAEIRGEPTLLPGSDWGGLCYHLVGSGIFEVKSLIGFFRRASIKDIWHVLEKRLFARLGPLWRFSTPSPQFSLQASYDYLLPVNLLLTPAAPPPGATLYPLTPDGPSDPPLEQGDYVRVEGFVVEETDHSNKSITLDLPPSNDGSPASYRLRFQPVEPVPPYRPGDAIGCLKGRVAATRYDLLREQVARTLGREFTAAPTLNLPGDPTITLPNPLVALPAILSEPRDVRVACIHGDLNLANVLVDADARDVTLIDFGMARCDHVLHDLLRLETGVVTWFLPEALSEAGLPAEIICSLYEQSHCAIHRPGHLTAPQELHPALRKAFVILTSIREMARGCLFDPNDWGEYYQGLTLYLMGALKFRNLDEASEAPLPKQVAFWGAAAAQKVLQEQPRYDDAAWQPLAVILDDLTGQTLGQYEIVALIDQGSVGSIYRARQPRLQRDVAIKVMSPALAANTTFRQGFEREAQSIARLRHPNILTVHDYGEMEDGRPYLVVDFIEGGTLRDRLIERKTSLEEVSQITAQVADALDYAHRQGVVHRDVKPNNILLTQDGRPLLADFGLAKPVKGDRRLTGSGVILGTPDYMAPEQAQEAEVDGRADIYALGVVLFEMLTGRHPFTGETPIGVIIKHISEPIPRPSEVNPDVPPQLDEVVARATAKPPDERYQRADDLARALRAVREESPAGQQREEKTTAQVTRPQRSRRRTRLLWAGAAIAVSTLLAILTWWLGGPDLPSLVTPVPSSPTPRDTQVPPKTVIATTEPTAAPTPLTVWQPLYDGEIFPRNELTTMAVDPQNPKVLYVGTRQSGIYRSPDGGVSWQHLYGGSGDGFITALSIDPDDPQTLYAIAVNGDFEKSMDGGNTWQPAVIGIATRFRSITLDPQDSDHAYLVAQTEGPDRLYESEDRSESWKIRGEFEYIENLAIDPQDGNRVYVLGREEGHHDRRVYRSDGPDAEWKKVWQRSSGDVEGGWALTVTTSDPPTLYLVGEERLYRSRDNGASWTLTAEVSCSSLDANPYDPQILYCWAGDLGLELYVSRDGGESWEEGVPILPFFPLFIHFAPDGQTIYVGGLHRGLIKSPNKGKLWYVINPGPGNSRVELVVDPRDDATLYALERSGRWPYGLYRSQDKGSTWEKLAAPEGSEELAIDPTDGTLYRFDKYGDEIYRSTDDGLTWTTLTLPSEEIQAVAVHPQNGNLYAICGTSAYVSTDSGLTWSEDTSRWPGGDRLYFDRQGGTIYLAGSYGLEMAQSTDGGQHWRDCGDIDAVVPYRFDLTVDLAIDPADNQRVFAGAEGFGVWASEDGCWTWEARNEGLGNPFVNSIAIHPTDPGVIYAATNGGVYVSHDGGQQWEPANEGLQGTTVAYDIAVDSSGVYVSTPLGIFRLEAP